MYYHYKLGLLLVMLAIPMVVLVVGNTFASGTRTAIRALAAVALTWGWVVASRLIVNEVDIQLAETPQRLQEIYDGDGAKNAFAAVFGWLPGLILVALYWTIARLAIFLRRRRKAARAA
jgi:hypothetical protein